MDAHSDHDGRNHGTAGGHDLDMHAAPPQVTPAPLHPTPASQTTSEVCCTRLTCTGMPARDRAETSAQESDEHSNMMRAAPPEIIV